MDYYGEKVLRLVLKHALDPLPKVAGTIILFVADEFVFPNAFPKEKPDVWKQVEGRVNDLVQREIRDALGRDSLARVKVRTSLISVQQSNSVIPPVLTRNTLALRSAFVPLKNDKRPV
jgi:hypothetical protein